MKQKKKKDLKKSPVLDWFREQREKEWAEIKKNLKKQHKVKETSEGLRYTKKSV